MAALPPAAERAQVGCRLCCGAPCWPVPRTGVSAGSGGWLLPWGTGLPSIPGLPRGGRRSLAGREACSDACSAREAEDILHCAGEQSCLPASTGLHAGRGSQRSSWIWHAEVSAALPNKRDPAPACQERAGSRRCPACAVLPAGRVTGQASRLFQG